LLREAGIGTFNADVDIKNAKAKTLAKLKQSSSKIKPGSITLIDSTAWGSRFETPTYHLSNGEAAVLAVNPVTSESSDVDIIDILTGPSVTSSVSSKVYSDNLLDMATSTFDRVQVDLTVDSRSISSKNALDYLNTLKELIESHPETLLK
jgi:NAD/NADP transhydrogenase alpha subunit